MIRLPRNRTRARGRVEIKEVLNGETPPRGPTHYPFVYLFFHRKVTPFVHLLLKNGKPFSYLVASLLTA